MENDYKVLNVTENLMKNVKNVIEYSLKYEKLTNRTLCQTGEIGELKACKKLNLKLCANKIETGIDAIDEDNNRVQIKSRRIVDENKKGTHPDVLGIFSKHDFDYALMVLLDKNYDFIEIWRANNECLENKFEEKKNKKIQKLKKTLENETDEKERDKINNKINSDSTFKRVIDVVSFKNLKSAGKIYPTKA